MATSINLALLLDTSPSIQVESYQRFKGVYCPYLQGGIIYRSTKLDFIVRPYEHFRYSFQEQQESHSLVVSVPLFRTIDIAVSPF